VGEPSKPAAPDQQFGTRIPVRLRIVLRDDREVLDAFGGDLGRAGISLRTDRTVQEGALLSLQLSIKGREPMSTEAEVIYRREHPRGQHGLGLRFLNWPEDCQRCIEEEVTSAWRSVARSALLACAEGGGRDKLREQLVQRGLRVLTASDGVQALKKLRDLSGVGVMLVDLLLPPGDGLDLVRKLRSRPAILARCLPVMILMEGTVSPPEVDRLRAEGASAVLRYGRAEDMAMVADAAMRLMAQPASSLTLKSL
jgi:CheY-like chemotaxis protein